MVPWIGGGVGPIYLVLEMLGRLRAHSTYINLSDGGHFENLGIYELLRRRCRLIIASDAGADPEFKYEDLADLVRLARIDFGVQIDMPGISAIPRKPAKSPAKPQKPHFAVGTIDYGDDHEKGVLIYIKASLSCDEDIDGLEYKRLYPDFPHQTTADQFFDEAQFEAYRALGRHIGDKVLGHRKLPAQWPGCHRCSVYPESV